MMSVRIKKPFSLHPSSGQSRRTHPRNTIYNLLKSSHHLNFYQPSQLRESSAILRTTIIILTGWYKSCQIYKIDHVTLVCGFNQNESKYQINHNDRTHIFDSLVYSIKPVDFHEPRNQGQRKAKTASLVKVCVHVWSCKKNNFVFQTFS